MTESQRSQVTYRPDIDGLRSLAVLAVVMFHFQLSSILRAGFIGVDIFFVISGFLILSHISARMEAGTFSFRDFYIARIRRLAPALVATTVLTVACGLVILTPNELVGLAKETIAAQLYVSNIYYWRNLNYFGLLADGAILLHTWSLAVEEQFYLVFPLLLWIFRRRWRLALILVILCSFGLNLAFINQKPEATFYLLPTRAWEFAAGAFIPLVANWLARTRVHGDVVALAGMFLLGLAFALYDQTVSFPGTFALLPVVGTMLLIAAGTIGRGWYSRLISSAVPVGIGRISYELYLVHWPVRVFAPLLFYDYSLPVRLGAMIFCFFLAALIYWFVEQPVRSKRRLESGKSLLAAYGTSLAALLSLAAGVIVLRGLPGRLPSDAQRLAAASDDSSAAFRTCEGVIACRVGAPTKPLSWLIFGDSHADALAPAFSSYLQQQGQAGYLAFASGCLPVQSTGGPGCRSFNRSVLAFLRDHPEVSHVVLVSTWRQPLEMHYTDESGRSVEGQAAVRSFQKSLDRELADLALNNRDVILWYPVPGSKHSVPVSLARNLMLGREWTFTNTRDEYDHTFQFLDTVLQRHPTVIAIRPADYLCGQRCAILADGRPIYHDDAHPAASQTSLFATIIARDLQRASK